ncbi:MAG: hypothetical protein ABSG90_08040 [Dehalococcoidia bacterium]|jgi:hypothetical protein
MKHPHISPFLREIVTDRYAFFWEVPEGKFNIRFKTAARLQVSMPGGSLDKMDEASPFIVCKERGKRHYAPLRKNPALHRVFCSITDDSGMLKFASNYGLLGFTRFHEVHRRDGSLRERMLVESARRWRFELSEMKRLMYLWDILKNRRYSLLAALMTSEEDGIYIILNKRRDLVAAADSDLGRRWVLYGEQPREAALMYLTNCINDKMRGSIYPRALPAYDKRVYLFPDNLLTAMWLMFLWEVIGEVRPYLCPGCKSWFDRRRSTRKTCSDRCRKRVSREKGKLKPAS